MTTYTTTYTVSCPYCGHDKVRKACEACKKRFRGGIPYQYKSPL